MEKNLSGQTSKKNTIERAPFFYLEKPDKTINKQKIFSFMDINPNECRKLLDSSNMPKYLYWDKFKHKFPGNKDLTTEDKWYLLKQLRNLSSMPAPIQNEKGSSFWWLRLSSTDELLHKIDMFAGGRLFNKTSTLSPSSKNTFLNRGIMEEAIASSQLEGAHTTRKVAKQFLSNKRAPRNESEQMILNNYKTINAIAENFKQQDLSKELLFEMHAMLTEDTIPKSEQYRFRKNSDNIVVQGQIGQEIYTTHVPPSEDFILTSIDKLIDYANDLEKQFIHPVVKAIFLHFWIGYVHPFTDGNGRLARSIFYWYLLRKGYWTFMYLPISTIIKKAPLQYAMAYIYTEQDNLDMTYFYDFHIQKIMQAITEFEQYLDDKVSENKVIDNSMDKRFVLNDRQKQLIHYLVSDTDPSASVSSHAVLHNISRQTASLDFRYLEENKLIYSKRFGKYIKYFPTEKLLERLD